LTGQITGTGSRVSVAVVMTVAVLVFVGGLLDDRSLRCTGYKPCLYARRASSSSILSGNI
jgi:hypothetical protein